MHRDSADHPNTADVLTNWSISRQRASQLHRIRCKARAERLKVIKRLEHRDDDGVDEGWRRFDKVSCAIQ
jgi:hypothetical protein